MDLRVIRHATVICTERIGYTFLQHAVIQVTVHLEWYRGNCKHSSRLLFEETRAFLRLF